MENVSIGRIVHVVIAGKHLPAIVTSVQELKDKVTLCVFPDGNVVRESTVITGAGRDDSTKIWGCWHWPEKEDAQNGL